MGTVWEGCGPICGGGSSTQGLIRGEEGGGNLVHVGFLKEASRITNLY